MGGIFSRRNTSTNKDDDLYTTVQDDLSKCVGDLVNTEADVNSYHGNYTRLTFAIVQGNYKSADATIRAGADVNKHDKYGATPLMVAVESKSEQFVDLLIKAEADVNKSHQYGRTPLMVAVERNHEEHVDLLIRAKVDVNKGSKRGRTPLMIAAERRSEKYVNLLIKAGADVNNADIKGRTPLMAAALKGSQKCLDLLIRAGTDVNRMCSQKDCYPHYTALLLSISSYKLDDKELSVDDPWENVKLLVDAGADVNAKTMDGETSLILASIREYVRCTKVLLQAGAHVNIKNHSALDWCLTRCSVLSYLLLAAGESLDTVNQKLKERSRLHGKFPYLDNEHELCLFRLCRLQIRKHLMEIDGHTNLFVRIPQLGLPCSLEDFLLYNISLKVEE